MLCDMRDISSIATFDAECTFIGRLAAYLSKTNLQIWPRASLLFMELSYRCAINNTEYYSHRRKVFAIPGRVSPYPKDRAFVRQSETYLSNSYHDIKVPFSPRTLMRCITKPVFSLHRLVYSTDSTPPFQASLVLRKGLCCL